jgi:pimeloyl-ACP methyl ester carboxylesterase
VRRSVLFRSSIVLLATLATTLPILCASDTSVRPSSAQAPTNIVIGFVGGFVGHENSHHGPVIVARQLQRAAAQGTYVQVFENRRRKHAYKTIIRLLDTNHDGVLSPEEKARVRIVLFGHSWGAAAAVLLARDLERDDIPVVLTVQVDSVAKPWQDDSVIPENVTEAINFYQTHGFIHGRREIVAADPLRTEILGNYRVDYMKNPIACPLASWWDRTFTPGHMQSECDPRLWSQIESLVTQRLSPQPTSAAFPSAIQVQPSR